MERSFFSERTAEYVLIPQFIKLINSVYPQAIPLYYWSSREGNTLALNSFKGVPIRVVALYARRPKLKHVNASIIQIKFNQMLFDRADFFMKNGIQTFIGTPIVNSLFDLSLESYCKWFELKDGGQEESLNIETKNKNSIETENVRELTISDIIEKITINCSVRSWDATTEIIKKLKRRHDFERQITFGLFGDLYKPVYFILPVN